MVVQTRCKKCGATIRLDFSDLTKDEALKVAEEMDTLPRECPGRHMELGGMARLWNVREAIHKAFDEGEFELVAVAPTPTDHEFIDGLLEEGKDVIDGGLNTVPELRLSSLHDFRNLEHLGFGDFQNGSHVFLRHDSPKGTRFYIRSPR